MSISPEQLEANIITNVLNDPLLRTLGNTSNQLVTSSGVTAAFPAVTFTITGSASALVYGELQDLSMLDSIGDVTGNTLTFGITTLNAGDSNNVIYGNLHHIILSASNGHII